MFEITVEAEFCASHQLRLPGGLEPLHGHNWRVRLAMRAATLDALQTVCDFHPVQAALRAVCAAWDSGHLNDQPPFKDISPSAERVAEAIANAVGRQLGPGFPPVFSVSVTEAPGCTATWLRD